MPLQGTFDVLDFSEVLHLLARHEMTGRLFVRHRSFGANLFVEKGLLTGADQSEHQPAANSGDVTGRIEEVCFEMLEAERGSFEFHPGKASSLPVGTRLTVDAVLEQAGRRLHEWRELQEIIPSLELQPKLALELGKQAVTLDQERWRLLTTIDGRRNLRAIGRAVNLSDFDVCRLTRALLEDGIVELEGLAALAAASREIPVVAAKEQPEAQVGDEGAITGPIAVIPSDPAPTAPGSAPPEDEAAAESAPAAAPETGTEEAAEPVTTIVPVISISDDDTVVEPVIDEDATGPRRRSRLVRIRGHARTDPTTA
jgi:hypothetical protein